MNSIASLRPARNLAAPYYVDRAIYESERDAIFRRHWHLLGPVSQVAKPGQYLATELANWHVFVLRGEDGVLRGFHNVCRHRGARLLAPGTGRCEVLRCPYHLWVYREDGQLRQAPWFGDEPAFRPEDWPLQPIAVESWRGLLFAAIDPETSLLEELGDLPAEVADYPLESYQLAAGERFEMRCNWKTYTDNFVEGYHIPGIHPGFIKVIDFASFETVALSGIVRMTAKPRSGSIYDGKWFWIWPNWTLSLFPGGMNTSRINPLAVDGTELLYHFYFSDLSLEAEPARRNTVEVNCGIVREDFGICESTQRNYASGAYQSGPLSPRHEQSVAYFQARVLQSLAHAR